MEDQTPGGTPSGLTRLEGRLLADRYQIENVVSSGASTIITEAADLSLGRPVTLKVVRPELTITTSFRRAFAKQYAVAQSLAHPNIAPVLDSGEVDIDGETTLFWVVEYLGGGSLRDIFDRGRLLEPSQALVVGLEACRALDAAHSRGVIHTEITPSKLVFGVDGRLRVVDFAMAELLGVEAWQEPATVATHVARYASPEQALSLEVDETTDVYALSLCLIEAVTGKVPFAGDSTVSTLAGRVGRLMPVTADMGSLAAVLERAGRPDPEDRWTAAEFGRALVQAAEALPRPEPVPVLAASLFASSLAARHAASHAAVPPVEPPPAAPDASVTSPPPGVPDAAVPVSGVVAGAAAVGDALDHEPIDHEPSDHEPIDHEPIDGAASSHEPSDGEPSDGEPTAGAGDVPVDVPTADAPTARYLGTPLILRTDLTDPPPVGPSGTVEMPASAAAAAAVATTPETTEMRAVDPTPYDVEREQRPWGKYLLVGLVALIGLVALAIAAFLLLRTKSYEVPDLVGVDEAIALNAVAGNDWVIETERERSDDVREIDHVVRTVPAAGELLDEGETFVLYVSDGPLLRTLPDLAGEELADAEATLTELELVAAQTEPEFSEDVAEGVVIRWAVQGNPSLETGAQVLPGTVVDLTLSRGPEPRPAPDLAGATPADATAALEAIQLVYAAGEEVFSSDVEAGLVVSQEPAAGTPVERGGTVTVQVSKGPELLPFPDLAGATFPDARTALVDAGFVINSLLGTTEGTFVSASLDGEEIAPGDRFPRGTAVDLVFL